MDTTGSGTHKKMHAKLDLALGQDFGFEFEKDFNPRAVSFKEHNLSILVNFMYRFQCMLHTTPCRQPMLKDKTTLEGHQ